MLIESESGKELIPSMDDRQGGEERCKWVLLKGRMGEAGRGGARLGLMDWLGTCGHQQECSDEEEEMGCGRSRVGYASRCSVIMAEIRWKQGLSERQVSR